MSQENNFLSKLSADEWLLHLSNNKEIHPEALKCIITAIQYTSISEKETTQANA